MISLEKDRNYTLKEIVDLALIPGVNTYSVAYVLVTEETEDGKVLATETNSRTILPNVERVRPGAKRQGKIFITSDEIAKYLTIHEIPFEMV